jgi:hypothetical protein
MPEAPADIEQAVKARFAALALHPAEEQRFPAGPESTKRLGYAARAIDMLPPAVTESFAGVGNPFALGDLQPGQRVLDLGCGAGMVRLSGRGYLGAVAPRNADSHRFHSYPVPRLDRISYVRFYSRRPDIGVQARSITCGAPCIAG